MDSNSRLHSQVAAMAGVPVERAMIGCYFADLSKAGKMLTDAATLMRVPFGSARKVARDWGVSFPDYTPGKPERLGWTRERPGKWVLTRGGKVVAEAVRAVTSGCAEYRARTLDNELNAVGSDAEVACRRLSIQIEERSDDDIAIDMDGVGQLAPKDEALSAAMQRALAS